MNRREFLMLAQTLNTRKHGIGGWFMSEKLDGIRCLWDGGISRGMLKTTVPWANNDKDGRYKVPPVSTGLWTRLGNIIHAPDWWLDKLPRIVLDGELWHGVRGHGQRQPLTRIVKPLIPGPRWDRVKYYVFDMPSISMLFKDGLVKGTNFTKVFKGIKPDYSGLEYTPMGALRFANVVKRMADYLDGDIAVAHPQEQLSFQTSAAEARMEEEMNRLVPLEGEGVILRKPESFWTPKRSWNLLKHKDVDDDEGIVTGYITGRETDKGSKLLGLMGALILNYNGQRLELSGFTDAERSWHSDDAYQWSKDNPGEEVPSWIYSSHFPRGSTVTFRYRGKTLSGIPSCAAYWRKR